MSSSEQQQLAQVFNSGRLNFPEVKQLNAEPVFAQRVEAVLSQRGTLLLQICNAFEEVLHEMSEVALGPGKKIYFIPAEYRNQSCIFKLRNGNLLGEMGLDSVKIFGSHANASNAAAGSPFSGAPVQNGGGTQQATANAGNGPVQSAATKTGGTITQNQTTYNISGNVTMMAPQPAAIPGAAAAISPQPQQTSLQSVPLGTQFQAMTLSSTPLHQPAIVSPTSPPSRAAEILATPSSTTSSAPSASKAQGDPEIIKFLTEANLDASRFAPMFAEHEITMKVLSTMTEKDLKDELKLQFGTCRAIVTHLEKMKNSNAPPAPQPQQPGVNFGSQTVNGSRNTVKQVQTVNTFNGATTTIHY